MPHYESWTHLHNLTWKTMCFVRKLFSNLVSGDDFSCIWIRWASHDLFCVSRTKWHPPQLWRVRERPSKSPQRSRRSGHSLTQIAESIRIFSSKPFQKLSYLEFNMFRASPKVLSQVDLGCSQSCQTLPNFLGFVPKLS